MGSAGMALQKFRQPFVFKRQSQIAVPELFIIDGRCSFASASCLFSIPAMVVTLAHRDVDR